MSTAEAATDTPTPAEDVFGVGDRGPDRSGGPWPGPVAYTERDASEFIGREYEAATLISLLHAYNLVLLHAPSGAGKSSLVSAAVIPRLRDDGFQVIGRARVLPMADPRRVLDIDLTDDDETGLGPNPYEAGAIESLDLDDPALGRRGLDEFLIRQSSRLNDHGELDLTLVVFDQFEEILSRCDNYADQQERFMRTVQRAVDIRPNLRVLFVVRDDHLGPILRLGDQLTDGFAASMHLDQMTKAGAEPVLVKPARAYGKEIDEDVVEAIIDQASIEHYLVAVDDDSEPVTRKTESRYVSLLTLQVVARSLWHASVGSDRITSEHLASVGETSGALRAYYEQSVHRAARDAGTGGNHSNSMGLDRLPGRDPSGEQRLELETKIWRFFEEQLISSHGQRQLVPVADGRQAVGEAALEVLEAHSIIRRLARGPHYYELCHDSFIRPIRDSQIARQMAQALEAQRRNERNKRFFTYAYLLLVGLGVVALFMFRTEDDPEVLAANLAVVVDAPTATAPDVVGMTLDEATKQLEMRELDVQVSLVQSTLASDLVLSQDPVPGMVVPESTVRIEVSAGSGLVVRDDGIVTQPGLAVVVDVLANDEAPIDVGPSLDLRLTDVRPEGDVEAVILDNEIGVRAGSAGEHRIVYSVEVGESRGEGVLTVVAEELGAEIVVSSRQVDVGEEVTFQNASSSAETLEWRFGDGTSGTGEVVTHAYREPGEYTVTLIASGDGGEKAEASTEVTVIGSERTVRVLATSINLRQGPGVDEPVSASLDGIDDLELVVRRNPVNGWYQIAPGEDHENLWVFGSLVFPQDDDLHVAVTRDNDEPVLTDAGGERLDGTVTTGSWLLITGEAEAGFEVLLPDGTTAFVDPQTVAIVEQDVGVSDGSSVDAVG